MAASHEEKQRESEGICTGEALHRETPTSVAMHKVDVQCSFEAHEFSQFSGE